MGWLVAPGLPFSVYLEGLAAAAVVMTGAWLLSLWRSDASVVDGFWGAVIAGLGWYYALALGSSGAPGTGGGSGGVGPVVRTALVLATIWGVRLSAYLAWRNWSEPEDFRYRAMREQHGDRFPVVSLVSVFLLQAVLAWVVSAPLFQAVAQGGRLGPVGWIGALVAVGGLTWEIVADWQLQRFLARREDEDEVFTGGLWRYSRHPNYFGEFVFWWGIFLLVLPGQGALWSAIGPILMSVLLLRVSGVPMLEEKLTERPVYRRYIERTNAFFPAPPSGPVGD